LRTLGLTLDKTVAEDQAQETADGR
jgi:hypothetical protein